MSSSSATPQVLTVDKDDFRQNRELKDYVTVLAFYHEPAFLIPVRVLRRDSVIEALKEVVKCVEQVLSKDVPGGVKVKYKELINPPAGVEYNTLMEDILPLDRGADPLDPSAVRLKVMCTTIGTDSPFMDGLKSLTLENAIIRSESKIGGISDNKHHGYATAQPPLPTGYDQGRLIDMLNRMTEGLTSVQAEVKLLRKENEDLRSEVKALRSENRALIARDEKREAEKELLRGRVDALEQENAGLKADNAQLRKALAGDELALRDIRLRVLLDKARDLVIDACKAKSYSDLRKECNRDLNTLAQRLESGNDFQARKLAEVSLLELFMWSRAGQKRKIPAMEWQSGRLTQRQKGDRAAHVASAAHIRAAVRDLDEGTERDKMETIVGVMYP